MADNSDTEVLAGIFGGLVVAIAAVAVVIGTTDGAKSATSPEALRSPAVNQQGDPRVLPTAERF